MLGRKIRNITTHAVRKFCAQAGHRESSSVRWGRGRREGGVTGRQRGRTLFATMSSGVRAPASTRAPAQSGVGVGGGGAARGGVGRRWGHTVRVGVQVHYRLLLQAAHHGLLLLSFPFPAGTTEASDFRWGRGRARVTPPRHLLGGEVWGWTCWTPRSVLNPSPQPPSPQPCSCRQIQPAAQAKRQKG
eukprot:COSAG04_NODE_8248_length_1002_cov_1.120709_2_plen_187_part_01